MQSRHHSQSYTFPEDMLEQPRVQERSSPRGPPKLGKGGRAAGGCSPLPSNICFLILGTLLAGEADQLNDDNIEHGERLSH